MLGFSKLMSKAKWFAVRKPSTGEVIATSTNQIVLQKFLKFRGPTKMLYYIHQTPLSSCSVAWYPVRRKSARYTPVALLVN